MKALFWVGLFVGSVLWFAGDWLAGRIWPGDDTAAFVLAFLFGVIGAALVMMGVRIRGLRSGRYEKAGWGVREGSRWRK